MAKSDGEHQGPGGTARLPGLTVRTLHHYDRLGCCNRLTAPCLGAGLYDKADVSQLHRVLTLWELGLPLPEIAALPHDEPDLVSLLHSHLTHVDKQVCVLRSLRTRLADLINATELAGQLSSGELLTLMGEITTAQEKI